MKPISELLNIPPPKIKVIPKKEAVELIADKVKYNSKHYLNKIIISRKMGDISDSDATKIYLAIQGGTIEWSKDYRGAFEQMCKRLPKEVKPKQNKLL